MQLSQLHVSARGTRPEWRRVCRRLSQLYRVSGEGIAFAGLAPFSQPYGPFAALALKPGSLSPTTPPWADVSEAFQYIKRGPRC
eukprot:698550-Prymnesium_polylepis.1